MEINKRFIQQVDNKSEYFKDILEKIPSWVIRWGNTIIFLIFILICVGFNFINYPEVISAQALITSENPPIEVYSRTNGRIKKFFKNDQDKVLKGDWIIELNNLANSDEIKRIFKITQKIDDLNFIENIETIDFPKLSNLGMVQNNYSKLLRSLQEYKLFIKLNPKIKRLNLNKGRIKNIIKVKEKIIRQKELLLEELDLVENNLNRHKSLYEKGVISKLEYEKIEIQYLKMKVRAESIEEDILRKDLELNDVFKESTNLEFDQNDTFFNLRAQILEIYNSLLYDLKNWRIKNIIEAPISGTLNLFEIRIKEQFITNEQKVFTINTNNNDNFFVLAKLPIENSGKIEKNQLCIIKLHNYPYQEFGMLKGKVNNITSVPKDGFYTVKVFLPEQLKTTKNKKLDSSTDLTGDAEIIIDEYTIFERLFNFLTSNKY